MHPPGYKSVGMSLFLTIITCGIYDLIWNYDEMNTINHLLGRQELSFWKWLFLSIITCSLFHIYYEYKMALCINELQRKYQMNEDTNLGFISILLSVFGLSLVVDAIQQNELNKILLQPSLQTKV